MFFAIFAILFLLNDIQSSRNCCLTTINQEWISKFSNVGLEEICNACTQLSDANYQPFGFSISYFNFNFSVMQKKFMKLLKDHYASNNGLLFCVENQRNSQVTPLQTDRHKIFNRLEVIRKSINYELNVEINYFEFIFTAICKNLVDNVDGNNQTLTL
ncbi:MAG: hypothetical protein MHMPM18_004949 [Marteilia pararefringens]